MEVVLDEREFNLQADAMLARIESALDACDAGIDFEIMPGGVIEIEFENGSKIVVNRHAGAREIWVAARSGGYHFRFDQGRWLGTRDGAELMESLSRFATEQAGEPVVLA